MTTDNFCFYFHNRLIQTSQTGGQWYSDTSPFSIPWFDAFVINVLTFKQKLASFCNLSGFDNLKLVQHFSTNLNIRRNLAEIFLLSKLFFFVGVGETVSWKNDSAPRGSFQLLITTFSITTLTIKGLYKTLSVSDAQQKRHSV
jgi:hypothetical protein